MLSRAAQWCSSFQRCLVHPASRSQRTTSGWSSPSFPVLAQRRSFRTSGPSLLQLSKTSTEELLADAAFYSALSRDLNVSIEDVSSKGRGRGLIARNRGFSAGEVVLVERPFVAACETCVGGKMDCKLCTSPIELGDLVARGDGAAQSEENKPRQASASLAKPMTLEEVLGGPQRKIDVEISCTRGANMMTVDGKEYFSVSCGSKNSDSQGSAQVFPVMVKKIAAKVLYDFIKCGNVFDTWFVLAHLTFPRITGSVPPDWTQRYELFLSDLWTNPKDREQNKQFFDLSMFYSRMMGMLHLNTFLLDTESHVNVMPKTDADGNTRLFIKTPRVPPPKVRRNVVLLYVLASFINHSCAPNVVPVCDESNFRTYFMATRDIAPGEEITVAYCDTISLSMKERREHLEWAYGFKCFDEKCLDCQKEAKEQQQQQQQSTQ